MQRKTDIYIRNSLLMTVSAEQHLLRLDSDTFYIYHVAAVMVDNLLYANPAYNITQEIIDGLNARYTPSSVKK